MLEMNLKPNLTPTKPTCKMRIAPTYISWIDLISSRCETSTVASHFMILKFVLKTIHTVPLIFALIITHKWEWSTFIEA